MITSNLHIPYTIGLLVVIAILIPLFEPSVAGAVTDNVVVTQSVTTGITLSSPADITMTALSTTQNSAVGSAAWTVTTNDQAGYTLSVATTQYDALRDGGTGRYFTDFASSSPTAWSVSNAYKFGMSARGTHTTGFGSDADCIAGADVPSATLLWTGFKSTTGIQVASSTSETGTSGTATTMCIATEQSGIFAPSGSYTATITATATAL